MAGADLQPECDAMMEKSRNQLEQDSDPNSPEHFDVLIIGAGISGIDAAYHLGKLRPGTGYAILEAGSKIGGTWVTHTFPGVRSDSDLFTFGFSWKPWTGVPIGTGAEILQYLNEAVAENDIGRNIRFNLRIEMAEWSSTTQRWTLTLRRGEDVTPTKMTCGFLWMCAGYFRHAKGFTPDWPTISAYKGQVIHPQNWPEDLDYTGKHVVVIGSGATAATLVPALAEKAAHVTMIQRSPTYYYPRPTMDAFNTMLSKLDLPAEWYHEIMRRHFLLISQTTRKRSLEEPEALAADLIGAARKYLGDDYDIATHFTPKYMPWRQRLAMIPDGDFYIAIREGKAEVLTDQIECFTETGLRLASGKDVAADIIVTATGLTMCLFGDIVVEVDGQRFDPAQSTTHLGIMFTGLPNFAAVFGYLRSSWTLRADLISRHVCRLLDYMDAQGATSVTPTLREEDRDMPHKPWIEPENFNPGYVMRSLDTYPRQGDRHPRIIGRSRRDNGRLSFEHDHRVGKGRCA